MQNGARNVTVGKSLFGITSGLRTRNFIVVPHRLTMKNKRVVSRPEACGVWLDTSAGRKRSVQTLISRSSYKLNNLFLRRPSSTAIDYDFTQTTSPSLCTKQTTISSFFMHTPPGPPSSNEDIGKKRKKTLNDLECYAKKSRVAENASPQKSINGLLDFKPLEKQLCHLPLEPCERVSSASNVCELHAVATLAALDTGELTKSPETRSLESSPPLAESQQYLRHPESPLTESQLSPLHPESQIFLQRSESREFFQLPLPESQDILQGDPDECLKFSKLSDLNVHDQQTSRKSIDCTLTRTPCTRKPACSSFVEASFFGKECAPTQIEFTQDSEGNMVLAHKEAHDIQQNNGACVAMLGCCTRKLKKPEVLFPRPHIKRVANADPETQENLIWEMSEKYSQTLESDTISALKENVSPLDYMRWEKSMCKSKTLLPLNRAGFCRSSECSSVNNVSNPNRLAESFHTQDSQGFLSDQYTRDIGKTSVQKLPLGDRTNKGHVDRSEALSPKLGPYACNPTRSGCENSSSSQLMPSLLFTQDSEGNNVIKHY